MANKSFEFNGKQISIDDEGYLLDPNDWNHDMAVALADHVKVEMSDAHWEVVNYVRNHFEFSSTVPEMRHCLKHLREKYGKSIATRRYIYDMFPYGYGQQACKIAGMRKPLKLILDL